ncbi:MAG: CBS domain-containing protein [Gemmatimonadota bacterium]
MARHERDYGRDYGRWDRSGANSGGMRSDGWENDWRSFPGEEGWYGEGYAGMPGNGFEQSGRRGPGAWGGSPSGPSGQGGYGGDFRGGYGGEFWGRAGYAGPQRGYAERDMGYAQGWEDQRGWQPRGQQRGGGRRSRMRAAELMTADPKVTTPDATIQDVARMMRELDVGIIPVVDSDEDRRLKGVITDRDIAVRAVAEGKEPDTKVSDCMTESVRTVNKNDSVQDVMRVMRSEQVRRVPVTDREGRLVGIIAQADLSVDYAIEDPDRELEVESTIERISEPARPDWR